MVRRRWAVAVVLLLASVLLNLFAPQQAPDGTAAAAVVARMDVATGDGPRDTGAESLTEPSPCADGTAVRRAAPRPARTAE
ncbi:hypothetical protein AB0G32_40300, partial [Streptomyces sp. NPDC023723]|uniref:hypothetical protein n=1 Tax=Streptomyces sp. NPDC023723 TaxID=3154323 RepID=UPI0033E8A249